eukprot:scaffold17945_cov68-Phaeocystis_antarctica.AAC.1
MRVCSRHARLIGIRRQLSEPRYQLSELVRMARDLATRIVQVGVLLVRVFGQVEQRKVLRRVARCRGALGALVFVGSLLWSGAVDVDPADDLPVSLDQRCGKALPQSRVWHASPQQELGPPTAQPVLAVFARQIRPHVDRINAGKALLDRIWVRWVVDARQRRKRRIPIGDMHHSLKLRRGRSWQRAASQQGHNSDPSLEHLTLVALEGRVASHVRLGAIIARPNHQRVLPHVLPLKRLGDVSSGLVGAGDHSPIMAQFDTYLRVLAAADRSGAVPWHLVVWPVPLRQGHVHEERLCQIVPCNDIHGSRCKELARVNSLVFVDRRLVFPQIDAGGAACRSRGYQVRQVRVHGAVQEGKALVKSPSRRELRHLRRAEVPFANVRRAVASLSEQLRERPHPQVHASDDGVSGWEIRTAVHLVHVRWQPTRQQRCPRRAAH